MDIEKYKMLECVSMLVTDAGKLLRPTDMERISTDSKT